MEYRSKKLVWRNSSCMMTFDKEVYAYGGIPQNFWHWSKFWGWAVT